MNNTQPEQIALRPCVTAYFLFFSLTMGFIKVVCCSFIVAPDRNAWKPVRGALPFSHDIAVELDHYISFVLVFFCSTQY
jgi:hypothetical protein